MTTPGDPADGGDLAESLRGLATLEQDVIEMVYFQGRTFRETAGLLAIDERRVSRALRDAFGPIARRVMCSDDGEVGPVARP